MADGDLHITVNHDTGERSVIRTRDNEDETVCESGMFYWPNPTFPIEMRDVYCSKDTTPNVFLLDHETCHCCGKTGPHNCPNFTPRG
jgi:hypothetical protein